MNEVLGDNLTPVTRVITRPDQSVALEVQQAQLKVLKGPDKGLVKTVSHHSVVVGSAAECDVVLSDPAVSRRHFEIHPTERGLCLRDLGSKNGTSIRGLLIKEAIVSAEAEIFVGQSKIRLIRLDRRDEYPLSNRTSFGSLIGRSLAMRQVFAVLERAAQSDTTLLLEGESGTGKDLAAESVHRLSCRRQEPFVVVDCGSIQPNLVESELFGHRRGSFTGANQNRAGAFETARGGTVFLDEVGEIDLGLQPKLLRMLDKREIKRLGENTHHPVDVRLIAATNRDLASEVEAGRFRQDLFYRLSVLRVRLPPLRDRREDIGPLARSLVQRLREDLDPVAVISDAVLAMFLNHDWPGNVRELHNAVERLLLFPEHPESALVSLSEPANQALPDLMDLPFYEARRAWLERFEHAYLAKILDACDGVVARAAQKAEMARQSFYRLMSKHGMKKW